MIRKRSVRQRQIPNASLRRRRRPPFRRRIDPHRNCTVDPTEITQQLSIKLIRHQEAGRAAHCLAHLCISDSVGGLVAKRGRSAQLDQMQAGRFNSGGQGATSERPFASSTSCSYIKSLADSATYLAAERAGGHACCCVRGCQYCVSSCQPQSLRFSQFGQREAIAKERCLRNSSR